MSNNHARLSPSNHKWVYCPGSLEKEKLYPDTTSESAKDGTITHKLLERVLNRYGTGVYKSPKEYIGQEIDSVVIKKDRTNRVQIVIDYLDKRKAELKKDFLMSRISVDSEVKVNPGEYYNRDDWWGTCDIVLRVKSGLNDSIMYIEVIDYKDGFVYVSEKNNPQLIAYMRGNISSRTELNNISVRTTIIQPGATANPIRYIDYKAKDIITLSDKIAKAAKKTDQKNAPLIPDNRGGKGYCRWCKHRNNCEAIKNKILGELSMSVNNENNDPFLKLITEIFEQDINKINAESLSKLLDAKPILEDIFKKAETEAIKRISEGGFIPRYIMAPGNSKKEWTISEEELVKKLQACKFKKDDIYTSKIITPSKVLNHDNLTKKQKERFKEKYIRTLEGSLKLKQVDNTKEKAVDMFGNNVLQCNTNKEEISFI